MSISCYVGVPGSGKSYEVVRSVILPAVAKGRKVITNIDGINSDLIRAYVVENLGVPLEECGSVVSVRNDQVSMPWFFPRTGRESFDDSGRPGTAFVQAGDLVAIDEAYRFWGTDSKISEEHLIFFREHRHFVHSETGICCDLVLMTQDLSDLNRKLKVVLELSFRTHKAKGIGRSNLYTITMWEGYKQTQKLIVKDWTQTYEPEIFPLYKSYVGTKGKEETSDERQNVWDGRLKVKLLIFFVCLCFAGYRLYSFFTDRMHSASPAQAAKAVAPDSKAAPSEKPLATPVVSPDWRIAGSYSVGGVRKVVLVGDGRVRVEDAFMFVGTGLAESGFVDGIKVTRFSGAAMTKKERIVK